MKRKHFWIVYFLQNVGISAFLGSIFAMVVIGRSHDFSSNLNEILTSRSDILRIISLVNIPGLLIYFMFDLYECRVTKYNRKILIYRWILNIAVLLITTIGILTASIQMVSIAKQAILLNELSDLFYAFHLREDILGPINMILFLTSVALGLEQRSFSHQSQ